MTFARRIYTPTNCQAARQVMRGREKERHANH